MKRHLFVLLALAACGKGTTPPGTFLVESHVLVPGVGVTNTDCRGGLCQHNENTDLINFQGSIFLVHRTAESQVLGPNSSLRISRSDDAGATWTLQTTFPAIDQRDIRDPHFYQVGARLYLKVLTRLAVTSARDSNVSTIAYGSSSADGKSWTALAPIGPTGFSFWRIKKGPDGAFYTAAYADGDSKVVLYRSTDGTNWSPQADLYTVADDTPLETELVFLPGGRLLALVRMDGSDSELFGSQGRLRTKICWSPTAPYGSFDCTAGFDSQRLDGPLAILWHGRLFVVARRHLGVDGRKRTSLFEITGTLEGGPLAIVSRGDLPSAGDTSYAGAAQLDENRFLLTWYSSDTRHDVDWVSGILGATDIWQATVDLSVVPTTP